MDINKEKETRINYDNFYIAYNETKNTWYARHYDEEQFDSDIIIEINNLPINLFNELELTKKEFNSLKELTNIIWL